MCLVFREVPSNLNKLYWKYTLFDIRMRLRLYLGERQARIVQDFENMAILMRQAFGDKEEAKVTQPQTGEEARMAFARVFGK